MLTFGLPTTLPAILDAVAAQAATALSLNAAYVFPAIELPKILDNGGPADTFVVLTGFRGVIDQGAVQGGGAVNLAVDGSFALELWNRVDVDESYRDTQAMKDLTIGILARWRLLLKRDGGGNPLGLQMFAPLPTTGGTQSILREPMRVIDWDLRPRVVAAPWAKHVSRWQVKYLEDTLS